MENVEKINFSAVLTKMEEVYNGAIEEVEFTEWMERNFTINAYIPITDKYAMIKSFVFDFTYDYLKDFLSGESGIGVEFFYMTYEILSKSNIILSHISNLEFKNSDITPEVYDMMMNTGLFDFMVEKTGSDCIDMKEQLDRVIGINELSVVNKLNELFVENININDFVGALDKFDKIMKKKNVKENLKFINNVEMFNNPLMTNIIEEIQNGSEVELDEQ